MNKKINITIVDDHELFREGLELVLKSIHAFKVVNSFSNGKEFIDHLDHIVTPDIVLMDIKMPEMDGIRTTQLALEKQPHLLIIALTILSDTYHCDRMIKAGASGFILKSAYKAELEKAIKRVYSGNKYFSSKILEFISIDKSDQNRLSPRETQVMYLICKGLTNKEIADNLHISIKTVEVHRSSLFKKANVRNAPELVLWAVKTKILKF